MSFEKIGKKHLLDQNISMLSYNKGFILAMIIDEKLNEISNGEYNLLNVINRIINEATSKQVNVPLRGLKKSLALRRRKSYNSRVCDFMSIMHTLSTM